MNPTVFEKSRLSTLSTLVSLFETKMVRVGPLLSQEFKKGYPNQVSQSRQSRPIFSPPWAIYCRNPSNVNTGR